MTSSIDTPGGVETIVRNIKENHDVRSLNSSGIFSLIRGFFLAIRLSFSDYDLICAHDNACYMYTWLPKFLRRKKLLLFNYGVAHFYFSVLPPKTRIQKVKARIYVHMQARSVKKADRVVTMSPWITDEFRRLYGVDSTVIRCGVDTKKFKPLPKKKIYDFVWVGTNPRLRGFDSAVNYIGNRKMAVVGTDGKDTGNLKFFGKVHNDKLPDIFNSSKNMIYLGKYMGMPLAVLEAMACGLNIITNREYLDDIKFKKSGTFFFLPGGAARKISLEYDWQNVIKKYNGVYREMTNARNENFTR